MGTQPPSPKRARSGFRPISIVAKRLKCIKMPLVMEVGLSPGHFVLDGDPPPFLKRRRSPQFSAHVYCGQTAGWIKMALGMEVGLGLDHIVLDGDTASLPEKGDSDRAPQFSAHLYCGQTAGCIKMPLGTEVGLGLRYTTLCSMWTQLPPRKLGTSAHPIFGPCLLWPNGWMDEDAAWYGSRPWPRPHCTRRGHSSRERGTAAPSFRPVSIVATVAHVRYC